MRLKEDKAVDVWKEALKLIREEGEVFTDYQNRECREILNLTLECSENMSEPMDIMKDVGEWSYPWKDEIEKMIFSKESQGYYFSYGNRIFNYDDRDQIRDFVIPILKENPDTRRAFISLIKPEKDSSIGRKEVMSLANLYFRQRNGKLFMTAVIRSQDVLIGWPVNIYQLLKVHELVAEETDYARGTLSTVALSAHFFEEYNDVVDKILKKEY